jgi:hypothetical protein
MGPIRSVSIIKAAVVSVRASMRERLHSLKFQEYSASTGQRLQLHTQRYVLRIYRNPRHAAWHGLATCDPNAWWAHALPHQEKSSLVRHPGYLVNVSLGATFEVQVPCPFRHPLRTVAYMK